VFFGVRERWFGLNTGHIYNAHVRSWMASDIPCKQLGGNAPYDARARRNMSLRRRALSIQPYPCLPDSGIP
jgi:hypothetical protein